MGGVAKRASSSAQEIEGAKACATRCSSRRSAGPAAASKPSRVLSLSGAFNGDGGNEALFVATRRCLTRLSALIK